MHAPFFNVKVSQCNFINKIETNKNKPMRRCLGQSDKYLTIEGTSYGTFLNDEAGVMSSSLISSKLRDKMVAEFEHMRNHSSGKLTKFLNFISYQ